MDITIATEILKVKVEIAKEKMLSHSFTRTQREISRAEYEAYLDIFLMLKQVQNNESN